MKILLDRKVTVDYSGNELLKIYFIYSKLICKEDVVYIKVHNYRNPSIDDTIKPKQLFKIWP